MRPASYSVTPSCTFCPTSALTSGANASSTIATLLRIAMHRVHAERRHADGDVLRAVVAGRRVLHPLAFRRDDCLAGFDVRRSVARRDAKRSAQHDRVLVELRRLSRLDPAARALHPRDAHGAVAGVHAPDVLFDDLVLVELRRPSS